MLITDFSKEKHALRLGDIMHDDKYLLPDYLKEGKFILAYRAAPKLGGQLIPYRFPRQLRNTTTEEISPPPPRL